jgi:serine/threonine-protein kinase
VGLVHRDLCPEKILLREGDSGDVCVSIVQASLGSLADTRAREALRYRAPEQLAGGAVGVGVDLFACGVIASEMLFGRQVMAEEWGVAPALGTIPSRLRSVLETCVQSDPERRYGDAGAAAHALGECRFD